MKNNVKLTILQINDTHGYLDIHQEWFAVRQQPRCITSRAGSPNIRRRDADEPGEEGQPVGQNKAGVIMKGFVQNIEGITVKNEEFRRVLYTVYRGSSGRQNGSVHSFRPCRKISSRTYR